MHDARRMSGFTLLEVMVALFILAVIAAMVSQSIHQRTRAAELERSRMPLVMCARALGNEFTLSGYWPGIGRHEGQRSIEAPGKADESNAAVCHWQLEVMDTPVKRLRRANLTVANQPLPAADSVVFSVFLAP